jgi:hypothetical protein
MALLPVAAWAVHQLRYRLAFGGHADHELIAQGHGYLGSVTPILVLVAALVAGELIARLARARRGEGGWARSPSFARLAAAAAASLVLIYTGQELLEGLLATGHPGGLAGVFGGGGWWSLPLALLLGAVIALVLRVADVAVALVARARSLDRARPAPRPAQPAPRPVFLPALSPFARAAPGRAPPVAIAPT